MYDVSIGVYGANNFLGAGSFVQKEEYRGGNGVLWEEQPAPFPTARSLDSAVSFPWGLGRRHSQN